MIRRLVSATLRALFHNHEPVTEQQYRDSTTSQEQELLETIAREREAREARSTRPAVHDKSVLNTKHLKPSDVAIQSDEVGSMPSVENVIEDEAVFERNHLSVLNPTERDLGQGNTATTESDTQATSDSTDLQRESHGDAHNHAHEPANLVQDTLEGELSYSSSAPTTVNTALMSQATSGMRRKVEPRLDRPDAYDTDCMVMLITELNELRRPFKSVSSAIKIHKRFKKYGAISRVLAHESVEPSIRSYFITFKDAESADRVYAEQLSSPGGCPFLRLRGREIIPSQYGDWLGRLYDGRACLPYGTSYLTCTHKDAKAQLQVAKFPSGSDAPISAPIPRLLHSSPRDVPCDSSFSIPANHSASNESSSPSYPMVTCEAIPSHSTELASNLQSFSQDLNLDNPTNTYRTQHLQYSSRSIQPSFKTPAGPSFMIPPSQRFHIAQKTLPSPHGAPLTTPWNPRQLSLAPLPTATPALPFPPVLPPFHHSQGASHHTGHEIRDDEETAPILAALDPSSHPPSITKEDNAHTSGRFKSRNVWFAGSDSIHVRGRRRIMNRGATKSPSSPRQWRGVSDEEAQLLQLHFGEPAPPHTPLPMKRGPLEESDDSEDDVIVKRPRY
ncbi:hypothetical protein DL93DRAFT_2232271 [Clavulina sp. PMI_390]|nr:hypothetical protein DL93DRAFT_2232271 [Clavulina sp. PMI_390]